jgi:deoxycytidylate deaminase
MFLRDEKFLKLAGELAELSEYKKYPTGCIVVYKNRIISTGWNSHKSHPIQRKYNIERNIPESSIHKIHAEIDALKNIIYLNVDWSKVKIYIYRKRFNQPYGMARPCPSCMKFISDIGIKNVYYTTNKGFAYEKINL